jgi:hypothetical protein
VPRAGRSEVDTTSGTHEALDLLAVHLPSFLLGHGAEDCRTSMIENVPLHRDIMRAWEEYGTGSAG